MIWVTGSIVHLSPLDLLPFLHYFLSLRPCLSIFFLNSPSPHLPLFQFLSLHPVHHSLNCGHPHNMKMVFFLHPRCYSFVITASLHRSAVAVHCCGVPVHPPASHWRHPHVHRGLSLWQCHRRPKTQRLRRHIHRAVR